MAEPVTSDTLQAPLRFVTSLRLLRRPAPAQLGRATAQAHAAVRRVTMGTKGTDVYFPAEIYTVLGVKPFVPAPTLQRPQ